MSIRSIHRAGPVLAAVCLAASSGAAAGAEHGEGPALRRTQASEPDSARAPGLEPRYRIGAATMNGSHIVFAHAGDLWIVPRAGGVAERLLGAGASGNVAGRSVPEGRHSPRFDPSGTRVAFSAGRGGGDVYVLTLDGGDVRRLTYHPRGDAVRGWAPDGSDVLFASFREKAGNFWQLHTVSVDGGMPRRLPMDAAYDGAIATDGRQVAYQRYMTREEWTSYRGGLVHDIEIVDLDAVRVVGSVPTGDAHVRRPFWADGDVHFLSARDRIAEDHDSFNLYRFDPASGSSVRLTDFAFTGVTDAAPGPGGIVLVANGRLHVHDNRTGETREVPLMFSDPSLELVERRTVSVAEWAREVRFAGRSGGGLVAEVRGDLVAFDPSSAETRRLTRTSSVAERGPAVSPDGRRLAFFSDAAGVYSLVVAPFEGAGDTLELVIDGSPRFFRELRWSPDARRIAFWGQALDLWIADVERGHVRRIARSQYPGQDGYQTDWSPDGRYVAYAQAASSGVRSVFIYDAERDAHHRVSDGVVHAESPAFDRSGRYLYFTASDNARLAAARDIRSWGLLSSTWNQLLSVRRVQVVVLSTEGRPPLEAGTDSPTDGAFAPVGRTRIDFEGIERRVSTLPIEPRDFVELDAGEDGVLYLRALEWPPSLLGARFVPTPIYRFDLTRAAGLDEVVDDADEVHVSPDGESLLYARGGAWWLRPNGLWDVRIGFGGHSLEIDLRGEWRQMYRDVWRHARATYLTPDMDGVDVAALEAHYAEYLPTVRSRAELNDLFNDMLRGHLRYVSHLSVSGGDARPPRSPAPAGADEPPPAGLLGIDVSVREGCHRIDRVYRENRYTTRDPDVYAPLDQPGMDVREGECVLSVNGTAIDAGHNFYSYFGGLAGEPVELTLGPEASAGPQARRVTVVPVADDRPLREAVWAAENARLVEERTDGRAGYVWLKTYSLDNIFGLIGSALGQQTRDGLIYDHRFNGGGTTSDVLIELLSRAPLYAYRYRYGVPIPTPPNPMPAQKVLLANQHVASAAETFTLMFRMAGLGPVVGRRTMGALVGASLLQPPLVDGGQVSVSNRAAFADGLPVSALEGVGITPDVPVDHGVEASAREGDPQLEAAIALMLERLSRRGG